MIEGAVISFRGLLAMCSIDGTGMLRYRTQGFRVVGQSEAQRSSRSFQKPTKPVMSCSRVSGDEIDRQRRESCDIVPKGGFFPYRVRNGREMMGGMSSLFDF